MDHEEVRLVQSASLTEGAGEEAGMDWWYLLSSLISGFHLSVT